MHFLATLNDVPGWIITVALAAITGLIWLIRLEGRVNMLKREAKQAKEERAGKDKSFKEDIDNVSERLDKTRSWVGKHVDNEEMHFGRRMYEEMNRRFDSQDKRLERIENKINRQ